MHRAVGLDREQVGDLDRADLGHAAEIVAQQIDDHQVLGALLLVHGEPGREARVLARRASARRRALHRPGRHVLALAPEEQLGREREHVELARVDQRAIGDPLLAPERGVERDRIALEGEVVFQREVDLIDVAGGDVVLDRGEGAAILLARPGQLEVGDLRALGGAVRVEPGARARIVERAGLREQPDPEQRHAALWPAAALGASARGNSRARRRRSPRRAGPAREPGRDLVEPGFDLFRRIGGNDPLRLGIEQAPAAAASDCRREGRKGKRSWVSPVTRFRSALPA